ncbi:MAG TPA: hypothetical protein VGR57_18275 [Ktedonobacterales bacterium]|nr:hypothetical protein [Ktedonobacterales bacterium]
MPTPYGEFRAKLDDVLRQRDPAALRAFLVAEGQWDADATTDPERALWLMIATSPALRELHAAAFQWLTDHGYTTEVNALRGRATPAPDKSHGARKSGPPRKGPNGRAPKPRG